MSDPVSDPRVYFAAERTMLAWLRTGIAIMAFGFVVARFGVFLRLVQGRDAAHGISSYLGTVLVALGVLATAAGAVQYRGFCRTLPPAERPTTARTGFALGLCWALVLFGLVLGIVLMA